MSNQSIAIRVQTRQIQKVVQLAAEQQERAPEFLQLLAAIVKVDGTPLKCNQAAVIKAIRAVYDKFRKVIEMPVEKM